MRTTSGTEPGSDRRGRDHGLPPPAAARADKADRKSTRLNSSHSQISYAVFCLKKKKKNSRHHRVVCLSISVSPRFDYYDLHHSFAHIVRCPGTRLHEFVASDQDLAY